MIHIKNFWVILFFLFSIFGFSNIEFLSIYPQNNQQNISPTTLILKWQVDNQQNKKLIYDLYLGESKTPLLYSANVPTNIFPIKILKPSTTYYWKIVAKDGDKKYESPLWSFKTRNFSDGELIWVSYVKNSEKLLYYKDIIFNIYSNTIEAYDKKKDLIYTITANFSDFYIDKNFIYLLQKNIISLYDINTGKIIKKITLEENYTNLKLLSNSSTVLLYSKNIIDLYKFDNKQFNKTLNLNFNEEIKNVYTFKNAFIVNLKDKIIIIDYSGKKLKEYKLKADIIDLNSNFMLLKIDSVLYLFSYNNQMIKIEDNVKNAFLKENKIYIEKNKEFIIYDISTKNKKRLDIKFNYKNILFFKNKIILVGEKIYAIDNEGNLIWKHEFQNDSIISNIAITNYNTIIFSLFDNKYYKIVEIYDKDIIQKNSYKELNLSLNSSINSEPEKIKENTLTSLPTPLIINPKYDEKIQAFNISLEWILPGYESTTVTYEIDLKEISSGLIKNKKISNISNNRILLLLEPNTKYIWKVIAKDKGKVTQSEWSTFSTNSLNFVLKRIKLSGNQLVLDSTIRDNLIYFTGYTVTPEKDVLKLLYGNISTKFLNLKAWDFGNNQDKYGTSIDLTDDGTVIIGGFSSEKDLRGDMLLYSLSKNGKINWDITTGSSKRDTINDIYFDNSEEYIYTIGTIGTDNMGSNILFSKYSPKGYRIWSREFGGYELEIGATLKRIDKYSFLLLGSTKSFGEGGYDYYIVKTNEMGQKLWDLTAGTSKDDFASDLIQISKNEYIILGTSFRDTLQPFLAKIDNSGFKIFEKIIPFTNDVNLIKAAIFKNYFYAVGWYREKDSLIRKGLITKFDFNGNLLWAKTFQINNQDTVFTDINVQNNKIFLYGASQYEKPNSRDIIIIQTTEDYILNNFENAQ
ncbi:hypothetical protein [Marinitoga aeolica]|uniref:Fibronectin type-III domain-containing protein n=1 Tax=Marinitoga aeolica TaxID=2809031 RepID=A0ABY8PT46_9BACT|nr:hypothetical protein [Marinitoga aeolica]WGS65811.1 hypothetical protein JRV97_04485 [Marinitoga aeolica]